MLGNHDSHATAARQSKGLTSTVSAQIGKPKYERQTRFKCAFSADGGQHQGGELKLLQNVTISIADSWAS